MQIISWNDYGEAHYIGPIHEQGIPQGAATYVTSNPHDAWRELLPYYIDAYKSGNLSSIPPTNNTASINPSAVQFSAEDPVADLLTYWYRVNPSSAGSSGGTTGKQPCYGQPILHPGLVSQDQLFVTAMVTARVRLRFRSAAFYPPLSKRTMSASTILPFHSTARPVPCSLLLCETVDQ